MKCMRINEFGPPSVLHLFNQNEIKKPGDGQVLIQVECAGVNPVDTYRRSGNFKVLPELPWVPGSDCAGTILEIKGSKTKNLKVGQRVFTSHTVTGSYSSHTIAPIEHVHPLPDELTFEQGAALGIPYFTAYNALFQRGKATKDDIVFIHGASGGVGIACIQLAKQAGMTVIGSAGSHDGMKLIKEMGVDVACNHKDPAYLDILKEGFEGKISIIIEMLANVNLVEDCKLIGRNGRIMVVGSRGTIDFDPRLLMAKTLDIRGVAVLNITWDELEEASDDIAKMLNDNKLNPVINKTYPLEEAAKAHEDIMSEAGKVGKIILKI